MTTVRIRYTKKGATVTGPDGKAHIPMTPSRLVTIAMCHRVMKAEDVRDIIWSMPPESWNRTLSAQASYANNSLRIVGSPWRLSFAGNRLALVDLSEFRRAA